MMIQFDSLMNQGTYNVLYNGGLGDIGRGHRSVLRGRACWLRRPGPWSPTTRLPAPVSSCPRPWASWPSCWHSSSSKSIASCSPLQDVDRAAVPLPDTISLEYPDADQWRVLSEKRISRYGGAVDLLDRDAKTKSILAKLDDPISMSFGNETPLEDVLKYIKSATTGANDYGDPDLRRPDRSPRG